jgi:peptide deformylase
MKVLTFPHPSLFTKCEDVKVFDESLGATLEEMWLTMKESQGVGLSANQIGLTDRMFVMEGPAAEKLFIVNPVVNAQSTATVMFDEGCLSAPGEVVTIRERHEWIQIVYQNEKGEKFMRTFKDIPSICVQHEMQHLRGESFLESQSIDKETKQRLQFKWGIGKKNVQKNSRKSKRVQ